MNIPFLSLKDVNGRYMEEIQRAAAGALDSGWYLRGKENAGFEEAYGSYIGSGHCVGVANGLDALTLILRAYLELGALRPGDEVIVPANTYIATILAVSENGLKPVLVEPDIRTYQIDEKKLEAAVSARTKAVMIVHLYGKCAYTETIGRICRERGLLLIEDNAQAHGCMYRGRRTGSLGNAAGHSFYPGKNLGALGDAGAVTTDDALLADTVRSIANYGSWKKYIFQYKGRNSRMDEIQAAVLSVKLKYLEEDNDRRIHIAGIYMDKITHPDIILPPAGEGKDYVCHIFPVRTKERDALQAYLQECGIQTMIHYPVPPHRQMAYAEWQEMEFPVSEEIHATELSLPMGPAMRDEEAEYVADVLNRWKNG